MFLAVRQRFLSECDQLSPKVQRIFLAGKITLPEAKAFSMRSRLENQGLFARVDYLHGKRHKDILCEHADMAITHKSIEELADELDLMPEHIAVSAIEGRLTPTQARFAARKKYGMKAIENLSSRNVPTAPYRERKYAAGTEDSIRNMTQVRPRSRFAHVTTRRK